MDDPIIDSGVLDISDGTGDGQNDGTGEPGDETTQDQTGNTDSDGTADSDAGKDTAQEETGGQDGGSGQGKSEQDGEGQPNDPAGPDENVTDGDEGSSEDDEFPVIPLLIAGLIIAFLVPWIVVGVIQIRKRTRRQHIQKIRDYQQQ